MKMQRLTTPRAHENPSSTRSPPRTPVHRPANGSSKDTYLPKTPEKRKQRFESPPSGAGQRTRRLGNEIEAALAANSMPSLSLALLRGHRCRQEHCVMEAVIQTNLKTLRFLIESGATDCMRRVAGSGRCMSRSRTVMWRIPITSGWQNSCLSKEHAHKLVLGMLLTSDLLYMRRHGVAAWRPRPCCSSTQLIPTQRMLLAEHHCMSCAALYGNGMAIASERRKLLHYLSDKVRTH